MAPRTYRGKRGDVSFDAEVCIHAATCVRALPMVFDRDRRPWILPDNAPSADLTAVVQQCPSGALQYRQPNGDVAELPSPVTTVTPIENGPLLLRGDLDIAR